jgi:uncharacterized protein
MEGEKIAFRDGPWLDATIYRIALYLNVVLFALFGFGWHVLAMFLIGAAFMKLNFFSREQRALQARVARLGLLVGLPLEIAMGVGTWLKQEPFGLIDLVLVPMHEAGSVFLCLGYVGSIAWLVSSIRSRAIHAPWRAVGRMALSTYIGSTLIATFLMYHWGLGWFGTVARAEQVLIVLAAYAGLVVFSMLWLVPFRFGPLEWLWRSLTYGRPQPIRRASSRGS